MINWKQISAWVITLQLLLFAVWLPMRKHAAVKPVLAAIFSHILLCSIFTMYIVIFADQCTYNEKWIALVVKVLVTALSCLAFWDCLKFGSEEMTTSIVIAAAYCAYAALDDVYNCNVSARCIYLTLLSSSITYVALKRFHSLR